MCQISDHDYLQKLETQLYIEQHNHSFPMAPPGSLQTLLSPAELSFLHTSLSSQPPIRPDLRTPAQFRPLVAETGILPTTNGSARICFSDGTEAIVGIKAEVERTPQSQRIAFQDNDQELGEAEDSPKQTEQQTRPAGASSESWLELAIEIPGFRDDDNLPIFLSSMLTETLAASGPLRDKLYINERWHGKLYIDVLLLSAPLSYPLPLLSLTTHLALLNTALPRLKSDPGDDPLFDDDWAAAVPLYNSSGPSASAQRPPITLLVMTVGENVIFDPSKEELAVAEAVLAITVVSSGVHGAPLQLLAIRTIDPPSRLTPPGLPDIINPATAAGAGSANANGGIQKQQVASQEMMSALETAKVWTPPWGGIKRSLVAKVIKMVIEAGGVGQEVLDGLAAVET